MMASDGRGSTKMPHFCLRLAGLTVSVASRYAQVERMCSGYEVPQGTSPDIEVRVGLQDIDAERDEAHGRTLPGDACGVSADRRGLACVRSHVGAWGSALVPRRGLPACSSQRHGQVDARAFVEALFGRCGQYRQRRQADHSRARQGRSSRGVRYAVGGQRGLA